MNICAQVFCEHMFSILLGIYVGVVIQQLHV